MDNGKEGDRCSSKEKGTKRWRRGESEGSGGKRVTMCLYVTSSPGGVQSLHAANMYTNKVLTREKEKYTC